MPLSTLAHNDMLNQLGNNSRIHLLNAIQLDASISSGGATTCTLDTAVAVGDYLSFNNEAGDREVVEVTANAGTTPTFSPALVNTYEVNSYVGLAPKAGTSLLLTTGDGGQTVTWASASGEVLNLTGTPPEYEVDGGQTIGAFALFDDTDTDFYGSFLTNNIESFGAQGTYILTAASVTLES